MSDYEYFELKYLEEINDLFLNIKELNNHYNLGLFQGKKDNPMDLVEFLYDVIQVIDDGSSDEDNTPAYD